MFDATVLEVLLDMFCCVLPSSVRAEVFNFESCLQFGPYDECFEMVSNLRLLFEWCDANPA